MHLRLREGKSRKRRHKMTKRRKRRREGSADDRRASELHLFMFVFMVRHDNGNRTRARRRLRFQHIGFTMLKFGENKSPPEGRYDRAGILSSSAREVGRGNVLRTGGEIDNGRVDENYNSRPA